MLGPQPMYNPFDNSFLTGPPSFSLPPYGSDFRGLGEYSDFGDASLLSLGSPFSGFAIKRCQGFVRCDLDIDAEVSAQIP
jgi:hypothetical protein